MKVIAMDQRSVEWLAWRARGIGSSDVAAILGVSSWTTREELRVEKYSAVVQGVVPAGKADNFAMARGRRLEPIARSIYEQWMGFKIAPVCCEHDEYSFVRASLDGWNEQRKIAAEIKAPKRADHLEALAGKVPEHYQPQCDHQLLATGAKLLHYISYNDNFDDSEKFKIVPWSPRQDRLRRLLDAEREFWESVIEGRMKTVCEL